MLEHYVEHHTCREARDILPRRRSRRLLGGAGSRFGRAAIETTERVDARGEQSSGASATPRAAKPSGKNNTSVRVRGEKKANRLGTGQSAARAYARSGGRWRTWASSARLMASSPCSPRFRIWVEKPPADGVRGRVTCASRWRDGWDARAGILFVFRKMVNSCIFNPPAAITGPKRPTNHKLLRVVPFAYHQLINRQHAGTNYERINMQGCVM